MRNFVCALAAVGLLSGCATSTERTADKAAPAQAAAPGVVAQTATAQAEPAPLDMAPTKTPDVVYVPTPEERVQAMLQMAQVQQGEKLYDLGCGDGRIAVAAARDYGARAVCIDVDPQRIREALDNVRANNVEHLVEVRQADLFETDFSDADVVTLYLLPSLNERLRPTLQRDLRNGARVVSHSFDMGTWKPDMTQEVSGAELYLWVIRKQ